MADMINNAGYDNTADQEHMRDSIKIRTRRNTKHSFVSLNVGPSKKHRIKAIAQELGTIKQIPLAFIRPALDYNKMKVIQILKQEIKTNLALETNKLKHRS